MIPWNIGYLQAELDSALFLADAEYMRGRQSGTYIVKSFDRRADSLSTVEDYVRDRLKILPDKWLWWRVRPREDGWLMEGVHEEDLEHILARRWLLRSRGNCLFSCLIHTRRPGDEELAGESRLMVTQLAQTASGDKLLVHIPYPEFKNTPYILTLDDFRAMWLCDLDLPEFDARYDYICALKRYGWLVCWVS